MFSAYPAIGMSVIPGRSISVRSGHVDKNGTCVIACAGCMALVNELDHGKENRE